MACCWSAEGTSQSLFAPADTCMSRLPTKKGKFISARARGTVGVKFGIEDDGICGGGFAESRGVSSKPLVPNILWDRSLKVTRSSPLSEA